MAYTTANGIQYGYRDKAIIKECLINPLGQPIMTENAIGTFTRRDEILWWNGISGIANLTYPHPGWATVDRFVRFYKK